MKKIIAVLFALVFNFNLINVSADGPIVRFPRVSESFAAEMEKAKVAGEAQVSPNHYVPLEGQWSNPDSAPKGAPDYFVVKTSSTNGGCVLKMNAFTTDNNGVTQPPHFTDTMTGEEFVLPYQTHDSRGDLGILLNSDGVVDNYFHYGILDVHGDKLNVAVVYKGDLKHPQVVMTWGGASDYFDAGSVIDDFEQVSTKAPATVTTVDLVNAKDQAGVPDGIYVFVNSPKEFGHVRVETTQDFGSWSEATIMPYAILGDGIVYQITGGQKNIGFFRALEL